MSVQRKEHGSGCPERPLLLLVDDDDDQRFLFKVLLEQKKNYAVVTAASAIEAEEILESTSVDLVVCDVNMPEVNGNELVRKLRKSSTYQSLPFVSFSADSRLCREDILSHGADAFCCKSHPRSLINSIEELLLKKETSVPQFKCKEEAPMRH